MTSETFKHPLVLLASAFLFLFVFVSLSPRLPMSMTVQNQGEPMIVNGEGKVTAVPNIAIINLGFESASSSLKDAQKDSNTKSQKLISELKSFGINEKDIKTTSYSVYPSFTQEIPNKITGYRINISYQVKVRDIEKLNDILDRVPSLGVNQAGGISFDIDEDTKSKLINEARKKAFDDAKSKAEGLASAAGIRLGKVLNISESPNFAPPIYRSTMMLDSLAKTEPSKPDIQPGENELSVQVTVSWDIR